MSASQLHPAAARLRENLRTVRERLGAACRRGGRTPDEVRLVAVTKSAALETAAELFQLGVRDFGENRPQQLLERAAKLPVILESAAGDESPAQPRWHLIGQLQRNKVRAVLPHAWMIHSVDSLRLLERISQVAQELQLLPKLLLQVNVSGEASKSGFSPEELRREWPQLCSIPDVDLLGLMTMAPDTEDEAVIRSTFRGLRKLRDEIRTSAGAHSLRELSMGMSHDFEIAVEEGATLVRLGSVLFEGVSNPLH